mmetsp:Transcript_15840/g.36939  ORF Transcript_15840/g.36939 Transcript_15840/m.36939 type:complete len:200 (-) Transcript_15840:1107-1706(-)
MHVVTKGTQKSSSRRMSPIASTFILNSFRNMSGIQATTSQTSSYGTTSVIANIARTPVKKLMFAERALTPSREPLIFLVIVTFWESQYNTVRLGPFAITNSSAGISATTSSSSPSASMDFSDASSNFDSLNADAVRPSSCSPTVAGVPARPILPSSPVIAASTAPCVGNCSIPTSASASATCAPCPTIWPTTLPWPGTA